MTIINVNSATFLADTIVYLRDFLKSGITDPITSTRNTDEKFVYTEFPQRPCRYPIIVITDKGISPGKRLGMNSEGTTLKIKVEIRIWARNVKERDELFDSVYNYLRVNQLESSSSTTSANLHDFKLNSVVNVSEENVKSKVMEIEFLYVCD